jgi:hypothetical protein
MARISISRASGESVRRGRSGKGGALTAGIAGSSVVFSRLHSVAISRTIALIRRERANKRGLMHTLAAIPGAADEGSKDQHSHSPRGRVYDKEERPIDDARCALNAAITL